MVPVVLPLGGPLRVVAVIRHFEQLRVEGKEGEIGRPQATLEDAERARRVLPNARSLGKSTAR